MSKKLVYTQSSGFVYSQYSVMTTPFMKLYADKIGANFIHEHSEKKPKYPLFAKFRVSELLEDYDRILFLDCDIIVRPDSPDLFSIIPENLFAAFNEGSWCTPEEAEARMYLVKKASLFLKENIDDFDFYKQYFNGGVFLVSKVHQPLFKMPDDSSFMSEVTAEQNVLNIRLAKSAFKTRSLPSCFNAMPWKWSNRFIDDNYFIHFAGLPTSQRTGLMSSCCDYVKTNYFDETK